MKNGIPAKRYKKGKYKKVFLHVEPGRNSTGSAVRVWHGKRCQVLQQLCSLHSWDLVVVCSQHRDHFAKTCRVVADPEVAACLTIEDHSMRRSWKRHFLASQSRQAKLEKRGR